MTATLADLRSADTILLAQAPAGGGNVLASMGNIVIDGFIDESIAVASYIARSIPGQFFTWIAQALTSFEEVLHELTGDSGAIAAHIGNLTRAADLVDRQVAVADEARSRAISCWQGPGAEAFLATVDGTGAVTSATARTLRCVAADHFTLCGQLLRAKTGVFGLFAELKSDLSGAVPRFLAEMGLAVAGSVVTLVSGTVSGAVNGAVGGAEKGWKSGGLLGAVGGFFSGGISGAVDGAEDAAAKIPALFQQAFANFVRWALGRVQTALGHLADFVRSCIDPMTTTVGSIAGAGVAAERAASLLLGHGDPGTNASAPAAGTAGATDQGTTPRKSDGDLIGLNEAIGDSTATLPAGYTRLSSAELAALGLTPAMLTTSNGFIAEVFRGPDGQLVVGFGGTTVGPGGALPDVVEDGIGGVTASPQTQQVLAITEALQKSGQGDNVVYTGHSLGGRLAAVAALDTGNAAVTYDAAGVSQATINYVAEKNNVDPSTLVAQANSGQVRRYYAGDDILTYAQERNPVTAAAAPDALGSPIVVGTLKNDLNSVADSETFVQGHALTHMNDLWQAQYGANGTTPAK